jgi:NAD(P)-dependent dehydrogenase (short-subunit alcohol dehydrogenase family)
VELGLRGKVGIVTGASRGIGSAIALGLAAEGCRITITARSAGELEKNVEAMSRAGGEGLAHACDLTDTAAPKALLERTIARWGRIDFIVTNAGVAQMGDFLQLTDGDWEQGFGLKFFAHIRLLRAAWPELVRTSGTVVAIAGAAGRTPLPTSMITGSVNAASMAFIKALSGRGITDGVRVNAINPGAVRTDRFNGRLVKYASEHGIDLAEAERRMVVEGGVNRIGEPEDIANMTAFLLSDRAGYLQGSLIDIDGGKTRSL